MDRAAMNDAATVSLRRYLAEMPQSAQGLVDLGQTLFRYGRGDPGAWFARSLAVAPDEPGLHLALSVVQRTRAERERSLRRALSVEPVYARAWLALSAEVTAAEQALRRAHCLDRNDADVAANLVACLLQSEKPVEARRIAEELCLQQPAHAPAWINLGRAAVDCGSWEVGAWAMRRALALAPAMFEAWMNRGSIAGELMLLDVAAVAAARAFALNPENSQVRWNHSLALLNKGDWRRGFADLGARRAVQRTYPHELAGPDWRGEPCRGRLLVHDEIGYGDVFNFLRYLAIARQRVGRLILEVKPGLLRLLKTYPPADELRERAATPPPRDGYDAHVSLEDLPALFGTTPESIPPPDPPLQPEGAMVAAWRKRLSSIGRPRVGLCWAGNPASAYDRTRSCRLGDLAAILAVPGLSFVSLQKGSEPPEAARNLVSLAADLDDFADTAAAIANLDLVISVETSVAHLAGAMHRPVWILLAANPAWRWPRTGQSTAWYPSAELLRLERAQPWSALAATVAARLRQRFER
jgi:Tfp pilus assembly protein PilF